MRSSFPGQHDSSILVVVNTNIAEVKIGTARAIMGLARIRM